MIMNTVNMFRFVLGSRARGRPFNLVPPSALYTVSWFYQDAIVLSCVMLLTGRCR